MKIFKRVLVGCLGVGVLALVILAVTAGIMVTMGPPDTAPGEAAALEQPLTVERLPPPVDPAPGEVALPVLKASVRVELDFQEGEFRVRPGEPGEGIRVEGNYDAGLYELTQETVESGGVQTVRIRFAPRYTMMRRLLTLGGVGEMEQNRIEVFLPPDVALHVQGRMRKGESHFDFSGLAVAGLELDLAMGEHELSFSRPNQLSMELLRVRSSMGEFRSDRLGNARFREARFDGSMGEMRLDLDGEYMADAEVAVRFRMGECRVGMPSGVNLDVNRTVFLGEASGGNRKREPIEGAPTLRFQGSMTMGQIDVD